MKILLTGHKGFIGSNLLVALQKNNHEISTYEWGDEYLPSVMEQDWVIHIGAISSTTERDIEKVMRQNVDFSIQLYEECRRFGVNFQFSSSASLYGLYEEFSETGPVDPRTPYAWSKYLVERHIQKYSMGANAQIFRYFNVYGPGEDHKEDQASPYHKFSQQIKKTNSITLFEGSENFYRDFIHVDDVVNIHLKFLNIAESGIWNVGTGKPKSFLDIAKELSYNDTEIKFIEMPKILHSSYQKYTCADMSKMNHTINTAHSSADRTTAF